MKEKCPTCKHEIEGVFDYPLIEIKSFERLQLPEHIKGEKLDSGLTVKSTGIKAVISRNKNWLPEEVQIFFTNNQAEELNYNGIIYAKNYTQEMEGSKRFLETFTAYKDIGQEIRELIKNGVIGKYLEWLEEQVGGVVMKEELEGRKNIVEKKMQYSLDFHTIDPFEYLKRTGKKRIDANSPEIRNNFDLTLDKGGWYGGSICTYESDLGESTKLARLNLEGKLIC